MIGSGTTKVKLEIVKEGANTKLSQQTAASAAKIMKKLYGTAAITISPGTYWDIQLGAFSSKDNARAFAGKVSKAGFKDIVLQTSGEVTRVAIKKVPASKVPDTQNKLTQKGFTEQTLKQRK